MLSLASLPATHLSVALSRQPQRDVWAALSRVRRLRWVRIAPAP